MVVSVGPNMFYTVTLPCTLWFLDKGKAKTKRGDTVLFLDARHIFRQISRAQRKFSPKQIEYLANIVRLYRGEEPEFVADDDIEHPGPEPDLKETFPKLKYQDVLGLCKVADDQGHRSAGLVAEPRSLCWGEAGAKKSDEDFKAQVEALNEELEALNAQARELEEAIASNVAAILEA